MKRGIWFGLALTALLVTAVIAASHPLVDHFGETAQSGIGTFGSKWIHTDTSGNRYGIWAESVSTTGRGLYGKTTATTGDTRAVVGRSESINGMGVEGINVGTEGVGVYGHNAAESGGSSAFLGFNNSPNGWGGIFNSLGNGVMISTVAGKTGLVVMGGTKSAGVRTTAGDRLLYTEESSEVWFTEYGIGQLESGRAIVAIDPLFAETVNLDEPYHVFVQSYGNVSLYVSVRAQDHFEVAAVSDGNSDSVEFSYRIVARRRGYESTRLEHVPSENALDGGFIVTPTPPPPPQAAEEEQP